MGLVKEQAAGLAIRASMWNISKAYPLRILLIFIKVFGILVIHGKIRLHIILLGGIFGQLQVFSNKCEHYSQLSVEYFQKDSVFRLPVDFVVSARLQLRLE